MEQHMQTIIFDMHGVIMKDPDGNLMPFINHTFPHKTFLEGEHDIYPIAKDAILGKISSHEFFRMVGFKGQIDKVEKNHLNSLVLDEKFIPCATLLKKQYRLALLSNDVSEWSLYTRRKYDLDRFFDVIVVSGDVGLKKPFPEIYEYTLRQLNQPATDCFFVDDRPGNLVPAAELGMKTILFNGFDSLPATLMKKAGAP